MDIGMEHGLVWCKEETGVSCVEEGHVVEGLYRETTCIRYPTLAILNLTDVNAPWVQADIQSRYLQAPC
jgi:hypothetical protein